MKKMYILCLIIITAITLFFLKFYKDDDSLCEEFLSSYGYEFDAPLIEDYHIPLEFDASLYDYNLMLLSCGYDLSLYKGKVCTRYTYQVTNVPFPLYANILVLNGKIIASDLTNPQLDGFTMPTVHIKDLAKYQSPATKDAVMP